MNTVRSGNQDLSDDTGIAGGNGAWVGGWLDRAAIRAPLVTVLATVTATTGESTRWRFERSLDCDREPSLEPESCQHMASLLEQYEDMFVARSLDLDPAEQLDPDALWMPMDTPWPGVNACREAQF